MSVYKPAKSRYYQYDFVYKKTRYTGSTGCETLRKAEAVERKIRQDAALGVLDAVAQMTLDQATGTWWAEKGSGRGDAVDVERRLDALLGLLGKATLLADIDQVAVAKAIEKRRGQSFVKARDRKGRPAENARAYLPSNATVNRDVIETLRPVLRRARTHWTAKGKPHGLPEIDWRELRLPEPRGLSRLYTPAQRAAWREALNEDLRLALDLILTYGLRYGELFFPLDAFQPDPREPVIALQKGRKRDVILHVPLRLDHARELAARVGRARDAKLDHCWFKQGRKKKLTPYTYAMIEYRLSKAADAAGITGARRIHGARHHAASDILRKTGNLKAVQGLLGHASITSSQRYAHVLTADLRAALEDPPSAQEAAAEGDTQMKKGIA